MTDLLKEPLRPFAIVPTALVCDPTIKLTAIRVYAVLASHKQRTGKAWCPLGRLSDALGVGKSNVCKALRELQQGGYIAKTFNGGRGPKTASIYIIQDPAKLVPGDNKQIDLEEAIEAKKFAGSVVSGDQKRVAQETTKYTIEELPPPLPPLTGGKKDGATAPKSRNVGAAKAAMRSPRRGAELCEEASPSTTSLESPSELSSGGDRDQIFSPHKATYSESQRFANQKLSEALGPEIVLAANDPKDPHFYRAHKVCKEKAKELRLGWKSLGTVSA